MRKLRSFSIIESKPIQNGKNRVYAIRLLPSDTTESKFIYIKDTELKRELTKLIEKSDKQKSARVTIKGKYNRALAYLTIEFNPGQADRFKFCFCLDGRRATSDISYINKLRDTKASTEKSIGNTA